MIDDSYKVLFKPDRDSYTEPFIKLKEKLADVGLICTGNTAYSIENVQWVFFWNLDSLFPKSLIGRAKYALRMIKKGRKPCNVIEEVKRKNPHVRTAGFLIEPKMVCKENYSSHMHDKLDVIFTWSPEIASLDPAKYKLIKLPIAEQVISRQVVDFSNKKLAVMINSNKLNKHKDSLTQFRLETIKWYSRNHPSDFDLYGFGWNPPITRYISSKLKGSNIYPNYIRTYLGPIKNKRTIYNKYKFAFCYENMRRQKGLVTEKIFDAILSGIVPIYMGAPDISRYIPTEIYIQREHFKSEDELYEYLKSITEKQYSVYLENALEYTKSREYQTFLSSTFAERVVQSIIGR